MNSDVIVPAQVRAGRAYLDWSQEQLAKEADVGLSTIRDTENGKRATDSGSVVAIRRALENGGVMFIPGSAEGGPGVRMITSRLNIVRRPTSMQRWEGLPFTIEKQGKAITVFVSREVLDDLGGLSGHPAEEIYLKTFEKHRGTILDAVTIAILEPTNFDNYGRLYIRQKDIDALDHSQWYKVTIDSGEDIRDMEACALMNKFVNQFTERYKETGAFPDAEVWRDRRVTEAHVFYFSPRAVVIAKELLDSFGAIECSIAPDLGNLKKIEL